MFVPKKFSMHEFVHSRIGINSCAKKQKLLEADTDAHVEEEPEPEVPEKKTRAPRKTSKDGCTEDSRQTEKQATEPDADKLAAASVAPSPSTPPSITRSPKPPEIILDDEESEEEDAVPCQTACSKMSWADLEEDDEVMATRLASRLPMEAVKSVTIQEEPENADNAERKQSSEESPGTSKSNRWSDEPSEDEDFATYTQPSDDIHDHAKRSDNSKFKKRNSKDDAPSVRTWIAQIRGCGRANDLDGALSALEKAAIAGHAEATELQNALLDAMFNCGRPDRAAELFCEMKEAGKADVVTFNITLRHCLQNGKRAEAKQLLCQMNDYGITPSKVTLNELLTDRVKSGDSAGMWRVIQRMRDEGLGVNKVACAICLKTLTESTPPDEVKRVLALLRETTDQIDEVLLTSAIEASVRIKELSLLPDLLGHLDKCSANGVRTNLSPATYGSMIKAHGQAQDLKQVWAAWESMMKNSVVPSSVTMGCMVEALVVNAAADEAFNLVREMNAHETYCELVNTVIYSTLMKGFSHTQQIERCFDILQEMHDRGIEANTITYNTLLDVCAKCQAMQRVPEVFQEMKTREIMPDVITYSTLIKGTAWWET